MKQSDTLTITILESGTIKIDTDPVSASNHLSAENFCKELFRLAGGEVTINHKHSKMGHSHSHKVGKHQHQ